MSSNMITLALSKGRIFDETLPLLAAAVLVQEAGLTAVAWLWLGMNLLLAVPVLTDGYRARRLQPQQA